MFCENRKKLTIQAHYTHAVCAKTYSLLFLNLLGFFARRTNPYMIYLDPTLQKEF
jgi:hypothetical protein